jgi:superfamily II DNA/RNA helicase
MYQSHRSARNQHATRTRNGGGSNSGSSHAGFRPTNNFRPRDNSRPGSNRGRIKKENIAIEKYIKEAQAPELNEYESKNTFKDFNLHNIIVKGLDFKKITKPTAIQDSAIGHALEGKDVIGLANTGTGKTLAFILPIVHKILTENDKKAIIIAPTRELAEQIVAELKTIIFNTNIRTCLIIGGARMDRQIKDLKNHPAIVVGTPGRIKDHINRRTLRLDSFNIVALDEVDRMLDMGFIKDITEILSNVNQVRQNLFFSATIDERVSKIIHDFCNNDNLVRVEVKTGETADNVNQDVVKPNGTITKIVQLQNVLNQYSSNKVLIFDDTQRSVERLTRELNGLGYKASSIHGGKSQSQRRRALQEFKASEVQLLVATDVAARGIDVPNVDLVINYNQPQTYADYIHRIGRSGRAGKVGQAITFI